MVLDGFALPSLESRVLEMPASKAIHRMTFLVSGERGTSEARYARLLFDVTHQEIGLLLMIPAPHHYKFGKPKHFLQL